MDDNTLKRNRTKSDEQEIRANLQGSQLEVRDNGDGKMRLAGYAVRFDTPADVGGRFIETIARNSFTTTLREDDQFLLRDHDISRLLARKSAGTLSVRQDQFGVFFEAVLPDTELARDTFEHVKLKNIRGCSVGFYIKDQEWSEDEDGNLTRLVKDVRCFEFTLTPSPVFDTTSVDIRSVREQLTKRDEDDDDDEDEGSGICPECGQRIPDKEDEATRAANLSLLLRRLR